MKTDIKTLRNADWDRLEKDVVERIRALKAASRLESSWLTDKIAQDCFLPALRLLAEFCATVKVEDDDE